MANCAWFQRRRNKNKGGSQPQERPPEEQAVGQEKVVAPHPDLVVAITAKSEPETELQVKEKPDERDPKKVTLSILLYY